MTVTIERTRIDDLFSAIARRGFTIVGPTVRDGAIIYDHIASSRDLPVGWTDEQDGGTYRLKRRTDDALFGYVVGPHSWKKFLFPPALRLFTAHRNGRQFEVEEPAPEPVKYAFIGIRSCELHALAIQDKVFSGGQFTDPHYQALRDQVLLVAVNCVHPGGTCFCVSMKTGPRSTEGFDLALTEVLTAGAHYFVVETGSDRGKEIVGDLPHRPAEPAETAAAGQLMDEAARHMGRTMETAHIKELLYAHLEHPRWDDVAARCLTCANCTLVCPTCFCTTVEDVTDLSGDHAERWRKWDSCFTMDFSYLHGGSVRSSPKSRYRQWMTHKLASWHDQFDTSGCVGCGRCITWCPVGIDITEEVRAIRGTTAPPEQQ
jgi:sulfhydrogenase subunit beta (sulfur reductase)